jgi:hypothetical protein
VIYEHENNAIRSAVSVTTKQLSESFAPQLSSATTKLLTNLTPLKYGPGALLRDIFSGETSDAVSKPLDSTSDRKFRDFCRKFGIDFEPLSGACQTFPSTIDTGLTRAHSPQS